MSVSQEAGRWHSCSWTRMAAGTLLAALFLGVGVWLALDVISRPAPRSVLVLIICSDPAIESLNRGIDRLLSTNPELARETRFHLRAPGNTSPDDVAPPADIVLVELLEAKWVRANED